MSQNILLSVESISKIFPGTKALDNVSMNIKKGEVLALAGENGAGKSTLMNIISGVFRPSAGKIMLEGKEVQFSNPKEAQEAGIGIVHQEIATCPHVSVAENIFMGRAKTNSLGMVDYQFLYQETEKVLSLFKTNIKPQQLTGELTIAEQQVVEIAKSLSLNCKVLILDEPTSSLTESETESLFEIIDDLRKRGISIFYISHRMNEIFSLCDRVTILRDGCYIDTLDIENSTPQTVINKMVGRELTNLYPEKSQDVGEILLEAKNFTRKGAFRNISFQLRRGEVLGFSGLVGAGRTEVMKGICGIDEVDSGDVFLEGEKLNIRSYKDVISHGIAYLTEDRKNEGVFLGMDIKENITAASLDSVSKNQIIDMQQEKERSTDFVKKLNIKISDLQQKVGNLSGGNQQKVMIAKWLSIAPKVLIMDEPTRGIDVGAKSEIHTMLRELSNKGIGVIIISSELPEIIGMCDRIIVMYEGDVTGEVTKEEMTEQNLITKASGNIQ